MKRALLACAGLTALALVPIASGAAAAERSPLHHSAGSTLAEAGQQFRAESGQQLRPITPLDALRSAGLDPAAGAGPAMTMTGVRATSSAMTGGMPTTGQQVSYQGPTGLAPRVGGVWEDFAIQLPGPVGAVHSVLLSTGKVLVMAGSGNQYAQFAAGQFRSWLWNPRDRDPSTAFTLIPTPYDMFCSGHVVLGDGNVLIAGGTAAYPEYDGAGNLVHDWDGSKQAYVFNIATSRYIATGSMSTARWYPGTVLRGNGRVLFTGGLDDQARQLGVVSHNTDTTEQYDPKARTWSTLPSLDFSTSDPSTPVPPSSTPGGTRTLPYYPGLVQLEDGRVFYSGESGSDNGVRPGLWNPDTGSYVTLDPPPENYVRAAGATVLLPPAQKQQVMILGGGAGPGTPATNSTAIIDLKAAGTATNPTPRYVPGPDLVRGKMYVGAVTLPDYTVLETNGAASFRVGGVHSASVYDPARKTSTVMNSPGLDRLYHSEALLLPSGDVAVLGSQPLDLSWELTISVYHPTYQYRGTRPVITGGSRTLDRHTGTQGSYTVTTAAGSTLSRLSLVRPSATTHSTDNDQRLVDLPFHLAADGSSWTVDVPTNGNLLPPGRYMMFALDSLGRPSRAFWVTVTLS